jgi:hypothetical protein
MNYKNEDMLYEAENVTIKYMNFSSANDTKSVRQILVNSKL